MITKARQEKIGRIVGEKGEKRKDVFDFS